MNLRVRAWHARRSMLEALGQGPPPSPEVLDERLVHYLAAQTPAVAVAEAETADWRSALDSDSKIREQPRREVRVAVVGDAVTTMLLGHEWCSLPIRRDTWRNVLASDSPQLLLMQVCTQSSEGSEPSRDGALASDPAALAEVVGAFAEAGLPTMLWDTGSAEVRARPRPLDALAERVDVVLAADPAAVTRYQTLFPGHRVVHLPLGVQPRLHNPLNASRPQGSVLIRTYTHQSYAGSQAEGRAAILEGPVAQTSADTPDRDMASVAADVAATVAAFRGHQIVVQHVLDPSPLMIREALEAAACGAVILRRGTLDSTSTADLPDPLAGLSPQPGPTLSEENLLRGLAEDPQGTAVLARRMQRHTHRHNSWSQRVDDVLRAAGITLPPAADESVCAVVVSRPGDDLAPLLGMLGDQTHADIEILVAHLGADHVPKPDEVISWASNTRARVQTVGADLSAAQVMDSVARHSTAKYLFRADHRDVYWQEFVADAVAAFEWADVAAVGKRTVLVREVGHPDRPAQMWVQDLGHENRLSDDVAEPTLLVERTIALQVGHHEEGGDLTHSMAQRLVAAGHRVLSTDRYNYVRQRAATNPLAPPAPALRGEVSTGRVELLPPGCGPEVARA